MRKQRSAVGKQRWQLQSLQKILIVLQIKGSTGHGFSREAAKECSPRRKAWVEGEKRSSPRGAKEAFSGNSTTRAYGAGICTLEAIFEYPLSWLLVFTAVAA